jgi:hypothetical protein
MGGWLQEDNDDEKDEAVEAWLEEHAEQLDQEPDVEDLEEYQARDSLHFYGGLSPAQYFGENEDDEEDDDS